MSLASLAGARIPHAGGGATFGTGAFYNSNPAIYTENFAVLSNGDMQGSTDGAKFIFSGCGISDRNGVQDLSLTDKRYFEIVNTGPKNVGVNFVFYKPFVGASNSANPFGDSNTLGGWFGANHGGTGEGVLSAGGSVAGDSRYAVAANEVMLVAVDGTTGKVFFGQAGIWFSAQDPVTGANPAVTLGQLNANPFVTIYDTPGGIVASATIRLGADLRYTPPAGYKPWNQLTP